MIRDGLDRGTRVFAGGGGGEVRQRGVRGDGGWLADRDLKRRARRHTTRF